MSHRVRSTASRSPWRAPLTILASLLAFAACQPAGVQAAVGDPPFKLVTIGDSYTAGNGAGAYVGPKGCWRSSANWGNKYAKAIEATGRHVTYVNRACSGAVIGDVLGERRFGKNGTDEKYTRFSWINVRNAAKTDARGIDALHAAGRCKSNHPDEKFIISPVDADPLEGGTQIEYVCTRRMHPQLDAISLDTDLVVLSLGGNDVNFAAIVKQCFAFGFRSPKDCEKLVNTASGSLKDVQSDLIRALSFIRARLPDGAKIAVNSYPYLEGDASFTVGKRVLGIGDEYNAGFRVRDLQRHADRAESDVVAAINTFSGPKLWFVDTIKDRFTGHVPLAALFHVNDDSWVHGIDSTHQSEWYHYNPEGHYQLSKLLGEQGFINGERAQLGEKMGPLDVSVVVDTSGSMANTLDEIRAKSGELVAFINARSTDARFSVVDFRDYPERSQVPGDYAARVQQPFTSDVAAVEAALSNLQLGSGTQDAQSMFSGLHAALDLEWRPHARKMLFVVSDAPPETPEPVTGYTGRSVVEKALALDRVEINTILLSGNHVPSRVGPPRPLSEASGLHTTTGARGRDGRVAADDVVNDDLGALSEATGGTSRYADPYEVGTRIEQAIVDARDAPVSSPGGPYAAKIGDTIMLDGNGSYGLDEPVATFEWDFDDDGVFEPATTEPVAQHVYDEAYSGRVRLRVTDGSGRAATAFAPMSVSVDGDEVLQDEDNCPLLANPGQDDEDQDGVGDECDSTPGFPTADLPGVYVSTDSNPAPKDIAPPGGPITPAPSPLGPGGAGTPPPDPSGGPKASTLQVIGAKVSKNRRRLDVRVRCSGPTRDCRGRLQATLKNAKQGAAYRVDSGRKRTVSVPLSARTRTRARPGARLTFRIAIKAAVGPETSRKVTLRVPK